MVFYKTEAKVRQEGMLLSLSSPQSPHLGHFPVIVPVLSASLGLIMRLSSPFRGR